MNQKTNKIECPNCGHKIDVNDILYHQVDEELKKKYNDELSKEKSKYQKESDSLKKEKAKLEEEKQNQEKIISDTIKDRLKTEKQELQAKIKAEIEEEQSGRVQALEEELNQKSNKLKEFNKAKAELERLKREKSELKDVIDAEWEKKLNERITEEKEKIHKNEEQKIELKLSEKEKMIEQLSEQLKDAQRKIEQGSMQVQGEIQELAIEEWLQEKFPLDTIEEIKKGARGADCLQIVHTRTRQNCGTIYYESKRTKGFQPTWIEKFKNDIREKGADIGVLVTESMPLDMERMGMKDGIWICTFDEFRGLCFVLREFLIKINNAVLSQENKGDKMEMLYDYLTGNDFKLQIEAIVEGFSQMQVELNSEKRAMAGIWKKREKQIEKVLLNTTHMYSSVKGIAGSAIQSVPLLELPNADETEVDDE